MNWGAKKHARRKSRRDVALREEYAQALARRQAFIDAEWFRVTRRYFDTSRTLWLLHLAGIEMLRTMKAS